MEAHDWDSLSNCTKCGRGFVGYDSAMAIEDCPGKALRAALPSTVVALLTFSYNDAGKLEVEYAEKRDAVPVERRQAAAAMLQMAIRLNRGEDDL